MVFLSAPKTIEEAKAMVAASHHGAGHGEDHATTTAHADEAAHEDEHAAAGWTCRRRTRRFTR